jgi:ribonucleoside-diphosphate reductase alpha subunit
MINNMLFVTKRDGRKENVHFDKITERINKLIDPIELQYIDLPYLNLEKESEYLDPVLVAQKVVASLYPGITTEELDIESAKICVNLSTTHPRYAYLGGRILVSNLHKKIVTTFSSTMNKLYQETNNINKLWLDWILANSDKINSIIDYNRDYLYDYFGFKTLEKSYLLKSNNLIMERPQDMIMRTAITLSINLNKYTINDQLSDNIFNKIKETYDYMSFGYYTHASPTLFNAGTNHMQLSSCFLLGTSDDLTSITTTWNSCAQISKWAGGIGIHVSNIRGKNSIIKGTGGKSNGIVPFLKVFNDIARWIDQGGKRAGSIAIYLEPHHPDIFDFLELRKNFGSETERARDLFLSLWISDLFMKQVEIDGDWYLLSSDECPGLENVYGDDYETLYWKYVADGKFRIKISARKLWQTIMESQIETGMPYILYKDAINKKCNQKNLGTIKSSNLCAEITEYSDDKEYAVCNLASIALKPLVTLYKTASNILYKIYTKPNCTYCSYAKKYLSNLNIKFEEIEFNDNTMSELLLLINKVNFKLTYPQIFISETDSNDSNDSNGSDNLKLIGGLSDMYEYTRGIFDYDKLYDIAYAATINLDKVIDINYYPVSQTKLSNMKHRPIGLGIQGLADALALLRIPYDSDKAIDFNAKIMEIIYLASITASNDISKSRYEMMNELITYYRDNSIFPEVYDSNYYIDDKKILNFYHTIKPNKYELLKEPTIKSEAYSSFEDSPDEMMNELIIYYRDNSIFPEFYNPNYYIDDKKILNFYHIIKPNKYELLNELNTKSGAYSSFEGSPFSQGKFQFDLWSHQGATNASTETNTETNAPTEINLLYKEKWNILRESVIKYGVRNSLLTALMPTASTSQLLGNNECFEFFTNNIYTRNTQAGDFIIINKYLVNDLINIGLWNTELKDKMIAANGSIQYIDDIPDIYKNMYKTAWEIKQIWVLKSAVARGPFVDQSQSMNIFMAQPDYHRLSSSHFWGWKAGLKTGIYYLRTKAASDAIKFTIDPKLIKDTANTQAECVSCSG